MNTLSSKERLLAALSLEEPDVVPVSPFIWAEFTSGYANIPFWKAEDLPNCWKLQIEVFKKFKIDGKCIIDMPSIMLDGQRVVERSDNYFIVQSVAKTPTGDFFVRWRRSRNAATWMLNPLIKDESQLDNLEYVLSENYEKYATYVKTFEDAKRYLGNTGILGPIYLSPLAWAGYIAWGMTNTLKDIYIKPAFIEKLTKLGYEYHTRVCTDIAIKSGVDFINPAWLAGIGPKHFKMYEMPYLKKEVERAHSAGLKVILHIDGACNHVLELAADTGADGIETLEPPTLPNGNVNIDDAKRRIGDQICLMGNVDAINTLLRGTVTEVKRAVIDCIRKAAHGGGYILESSENLCTNTPIKNLLSFIRTGRKYGKYPQRNPSE
ncbi:MAG: uroporphyrinogen decarboxylase family protein [Candidatus Bathyarchaeia archaeon]